MDSKLFKSTLNQLSDIYGDVIPELINGYEILEAADDSDDIPEYAEYTNDDAIERDYMAAMNKLARDVDRVIDAETNAKNQ